MFDIVGEIKFIEIIAKGNSIREVPRLNKIYGRGRWRKLKGMAEIKINNRYAIAELHWYEAHGIGRKEIKIKRIDKWIT